MLHIVLPGLLGPLSAADSGSLATIDAPYLLNILRRSVCERSLASATYALVLPGMTQRFPIAALSYLADFGSLPDRPCFRCDPVHLQAGLADAVLFDAREFEISEHDAQQLAAAFNNHFNGDGVKLIFAEPTRWYLLMNESRDLDTPAVREISGKNLGVYLPQGQHTAFWNRLLNETQMLFYQHSLNAQREEQGRPAINGVWVYGGNPITDFDFEYRHIVTDDALCTGIALYKGVDHRPLLPSDISISENTLIYSECLDALSRQDSGQWVSKLNELDEILFNPVWHALSRRQIRHVVIDTGEAGRFRFSANRILNTWRAIRYHKRSIQSYIA